MEHVFEKAGLGKSPYTFKGVCSIPSSHLAAHNPDAYNTQMRVLPKGYHIGSCSFCGHPLVHNYLLESSDGNKFSVGCECIYKSGDANLSALTIEEEKKRKREYRKTLRDGKASQTKKEREARWAKEREENRIRMGELFPEIVTILNGDLKENYFLIDMKKNLDTGYMLSEAQINAIRKTVEKQSVEEQFTSANMDVVVGKQTIKGLLLTIKEVYNQFSRKLDYKALFLTDKGFKVYGTCPKGIVYEDRGKVFEFVGTVETSPSDPKFGFYKRPSKATLVEV